LEQVFVIMTPPDKERYQLEKRIEEKIQQKLRDE
jgi:hypothetical protein